MIAKHNEHLMISFPRWFIIFMCFCGSGTLLLSVFGIIWLIYKGILFENFFRFLAMAGFLLGTLWIFAKLLFYSLTANERVLESDNIIGSQKFFRWDEIIEVRRPRLGIPVDYSYVISSDKGKIRLVRSMTNYKKLIQLIKEKLQIYVNVNTEKTHLK